MHITLELSIIACTVCDRVGETVEPKMLINNYTHPIYPQWHQYGLGYGLVILGIVSLPN